MDDRTLLELAAKAAGLEFDSGRQLNPTYYLVREVGSALNDDWRGWNPLANDGDAFRLAVKLGLSMTPIPVFSEHKHGVTAKLYRNSSAIYRGREKNIEFDEWYESDPYAATRRAIVRAAAAIGEGMG